MIRKESDPAFINRIVNSSAVRPFVDYSGTSAPLDLSPAMGRATQTGIVWLSNGEDAVAAFPHTGDREYRADLFFGATCRGRRALDLAREMLDYLRPFADRVWGAIPTGQRATLWFARALGFSVIGHDEYEGEGPVVIVSLALS